MDGILHLTAVDYFLIVVLLVAVAIGWARGLVDMLTGLVVFLISLFVSGRYTGAVVDWLNRVWSLHETLAAALERRINLPAEAYSVPASGIPWHKALQWLEEMPIPEVYRQTLAQRVEDWSQVAGAQTAATYIVNQIATGILSAAVFVVLLLVVGWGLGILGRLVSDQIKELPLIGTVNRMAGAATSLFEVAVGLSMLVALVVPALSIYGMNGLNNSVQNAQLTLYFLAFFEWIRHYLFLASGGAFFAG